MGWLVAASAQADTIRIASFNTELARKGPGLLLRDIGKNDPQVTAVQRVIVRAGGDIVVLQGIDYDFNGLAISALRDGIADLGQEYPHTFALRPNSGWQTGIDLDGDGRIGGPRDAQGYGLFSGQGGMAVLSRFPILTDEVVDLSGLLWAQQEWAEGPRAPGVLRPQAASVQRLSSVGHWAVPVLLPGGGRITLLVFHASPPVFDGPEDRNGYRNADELRLWLAYLDGTVPGARTGPFVIAGDANADMARGEGRKPALRALLNDPRLRDPVPVSGSGHADTVIWKQTGPMRVDYILPAADLPVLAAGVVSPGPEDSFAPVVDQASRHRLVWVDLVLDQ
ncbi:3-phytase (myo-inositol-hexaphosphate 3-phosphohydrolase) [Thalassovita gelatinovora]|uniref:3-phytase (Myo-inositol-hexaphosphate 3-phosphohydrolase) n=1 Tax=Thalassovita gelatinovora TaxID=53501 RepID=A0A0P1F954_THAGE|nr:endonuclease/exonuclease/phosphatase family protein [Thalassovita gelatinovora]QIZ81202.1 endonuclease/exonuclease/phosphatase family protein [Thalassovita gelatinovora]CUH64716.1 3-phytase (myo-inositol-hexaphosphate 3-phosphohydrolase) [Thalassovita gelatinovora]SEP93128.1 Metal-dependent hydrolase, endonuclease/exonuclease/phosphatase family [Thalassovita gelatinovora]